MKRISLNRTGPALSASALLGSAFMRQGQNDGADLRTQLRMSEEDERLEATIIEAISRKPKGRDFMIDLPSLVASRFTTYVSDRRLAVTYSRLKWAYPHSCTAIQTFGGTAMKGVTIGVDIGKSSFHVHGVDDNGKMVVSKSLKRVQVKPFFSRQTSCLIGMESCSTSNYWAREITMLGHDVRLIPAAYVKAFVKRGKSDRRDAEAICEAVKRPNLLFVPIKSEEQQSVLALHRTRNLLTNQSVMLRNSMRSWLAEFGIVAPMGKLQFVKMIVETMRFAPLPKYAKRALMILVGVWKRVEADIKSIEKDLMVWHKKNAASKRLTTIPGIGYLTATAIVSTVGDFRRFKTGQQFASWLGVVPRQISTGGRTTLGKISKKGDVYLRRLLYLCAFAVMTWARKRSDPLSAWAIKLSERKTKKLVCMAIANRLARIIWVISVRKEDYREAAAVI